MAAPATETAISRRLAAGLLALGVLAAGCGAATHPPASSGARNPSANTGAFAWLRPGPPPAGWLTAGIPTGAILAYPSGWRTAPGDPGSATVVLSGDGQHYLGYLNITPRQGDETVSNWGSFRAQHNAQEGARAVATFASARGLRFRTGTGACVQDGYTTTTGNRFIELACLVQGKRAQTVIVGATTPQRWGQVGPLLERAISAFTT